ncbi:MAG: hypothetical protein OER56_16235, partial [Hyphomicrobiales bacterium]|nr:hypothetical protein [Hyphomicrobiales bacterium]
MPSHRPADTELHRYQAPNNDEGSDRLYGFSLYGLWVAAGSIVKKIQAQAKDSSPEPHLPAASRTDPHPTPEQDGATTRPAMQTFDQPTTHNDARPARDEAGQPAAVGIPESSAPRFVQPAVAGDARTDATGAANTGHPAGDVFAAQPSSPAASLAPAISSSGGTAGGQTNGAGGDVQFYVAELGDLTEFQLFDALTVPWPDAFEHLVPTQVDEYVALVAGDYYDIQVVIDTGPSTGLTAAASELDIQFGSVLHSAASDYDLVVIEQDLVEINLIVQLNFGTYGNIAPTGLADAAQGNIAEIVDYVDPSALHVTFGDVINAATTQQINYLAQAEFGTQFNHATILNAVDSDVALDDSSFAPALFGDDLQDLRPAFAGEVDPSLLYVSGTYYEINLVYQLSDWSTQPDLSVRLNSALINDFDGIARHQIVGEDQYDLNAVLQINSFSKLDQSQP